MSLAPKALILGITLLAGATQLGCRACGTCHDYAPPVADCHCNACGTGRSGSALNYAANETGEPTTQVAEQPTDTVTR